MPSYDRALHALRTWLDSSAGIGHVAVGMHREGFDLQLTQYDERGWRATFYTTGMEHSPTSATGLVVPVMARHSLELRDSSCRRGWCVCDGSPDLVPSVNDHALTVSPAGGRSVHNKNI
jgi:hypothetical protein